MNGSPEIASSPRQDKPPESRLSFYLLRLQCIQSMQNSIEKSKNKYQKNIKQIPKKYQPNIKQIPNKYQINIISAPYLQNLKEIIFLSLAGTLYAINPLDAN